VIFVLGIQLFELEVLGAPPPPITVVGGCKTAVAGELGELSAPAACCPTSLSLFSTAVVSN